MNNGTVITLKAVIARFQIEGIHSLPESSASGEDYQKEPHRHLFHFEVTVNAFEDENRVLNGVAIRRMCVNKFLPNNVLIPGLYVFGEMQPLDIADWLCKALWEALEGRGVRVQVLEDGENGAVVTYGMENT
jgi:hypothetical protein